MTTILYRNSVIHFPMRDREFRLKTPNGQFPQNAPRHIWDFPHNFPFDGRYNQQPAVDEILSENAARPRQDKMALLTSVNSFVYLLRSICVIIIIIITSIVVIRIYLYRNHAVMIVAPRTIFVCNMSRHFITKHHSRSWFCTLGNNFLWLYSTNCVKCPTRVLIDGQRPTIREVGGNWG